MIIEAVMYWPRKYVPEVFIFCLFDRSNNKAYKILGVNYKNLLVVNYFNCRLFFEKFDALYSVTPILNCCKRVQPGSVELR